VVAVVLNYPARGGGAPHSRRTTYSKRSTREEVMLRILLGVGYSKTLVNVGSNTRDLAIKYRPCAHSHYCTHI